jgi:hypothetical protein
MQVISRKDLAAKWHIDPRNAIFGRLPVAIQFKEGKKTKRLFNASFAEIEPIQLLDYLRLQREKNPVRQRLLEKHLEQIYGPGFLGILERKLQVSK